MKRASGAGKERQGRASGKRTGKRQPIVASFPNISALRFLSGSDIKLNTQLLLSALRNRLLIRQDEDCEINDNFSSRFAAKPMPWPLELPAHQRVAVSHSGCIVPFWSAMG